MDDARQPNEQDAAAPPLWRDQDHGEAPFFLFADHASNATPPDLHQLGLPGDVLSTHIGYDIGSAETTAEMARILQCKAFFCNFSRLVLDPNRALDRADLIPPESDKIPVPGNHGLSVADREARIARFHVPYHRALEARIDAAARRGAFIVSVHSFTPRLMGDEEDRPWQVGLLWRQDPDSARAMISWLETNTEWVVGDNRPYDAREFNYSVDRHVAPRALRHLTIEIRQDLIGDPERARRVAHLIAAGVRHAAEQRVEAD